MEKIKLTQLSHGGGCGCKLASAVLSRIIAQSPLQTLPGDLLVGLETSDDAAVYRLNETQAVVATTDFFTPIVDDPRDFGRIAATNALSDVYAMGGRPIFALAVVGMPIAKLPEDVIHAILAGGASVCAEAGIPIAGGHSIDTPEPIYGLAAIGLVRPDQIKTNKGAQADDVLILGKPLGIGILSAALKRGILSPAGYDEMVRWTTNLNITGMGLAAMPGVHALTDVTGFGLTGHLLEICRGSRLDCAVEFGKLPLIEEAVAHVKAGIATGASARNWTSHGASVDLALGMAEWQQKIITDPQTSGGLLVACPRQEADRVLAAFRADGFGEAAIIGRFSAQAGAAPILSFRA
jgi:selenide,water dikinase